MARLLSPVIALVTVAVALTSAITSCSSFDSSADPPASGDGGVDAAVDGAVACSPDLTSDPSNCGQCGHACGANEACEKGACRPGCADKTIHVSIETGDDTRDGCAVDRPMKTIGAAIARAKVLQAKDHTIAACRGVYPVLSLVLDYPVSLRGGYECTSFKRTTDFGYPKFDVTTETRIDDANQGADRTTLTISGAAITRSTIIDGFTITGAATGPARSIAVSIGAGAAPALRDLRILGGGTTPPTGLASRGLVSVNASPEVSASRITGGTGSALDGTSVDIIGAHLVGGTPFLHDLEVIGSETIARPLATAVYLQGVQATGVNAWHDVTFGGGPATYASNALQLQTSTTLELSKAKLASGNVTCTSAQPCSSIAVLAGNSDVTIDSSHIYGGDTTGTSSTIYGVFSDLGKTTLTNNVIVAGNALRHVEPHVAGVVIVRSVTARIVHQTILFPENASATVGSQSGIYITGASANVDAENNLIVGSGGSVLAGVRVDSGDCDTSGSYFSKLRGNAFVNVATVADAHGAPACARYPYATITDAQAGLLNLAIEAPSNNVRLATACGNDPVPSTCQVCASPGACAAAVVSPWTDGTSPNGTELFATPSYGLPANAACLVATGGGTLTPPVTIDLNKKPRGAKPSIGAFELAGACAP